MAAMLLGAAPPTVPPATVAGTVLVFKRGGGPGTVNTHLVRDARFTAKDLLRRVFPDLDDDGHYRQILPVRPVPGATAPEMGAGYAQAPGDPALTMEPPTAAVVQDGRHAIGFVLGGGVLIADWLLPVPAGGQALFVQTDPGGQPTIERAFVVGEGAAVALVSNSHFNSEEGFESYRLYVQSFSGLNQVYAGPDLYTFFQPDAQCGRLRVSQTLTEARPLPLRHAGRADIAMTVTESTNCTNNEAADVKLRPFHFVLTWDAKANHYRGGSPALERINRKRMKQ